MKNAIQSEIARAVLRYCKRRRFCIRCRAARAERGKSKCAACNQYEHDTAPARLRRKYRRLDAAGMCVRCGQNPQQATNKRCAACQSYHNGIKRTMRQRDRKP